MLAPRKYTAYYPSVPNSYTQKLSDRENIFDKFRGSPADCCGNQFKTGYNHNFIGFSGQL